MQNRIFKNIFLLALAAVIVVSVLLAASYAGRREKQAREDIKAMADTAVQMYYYADKDTEALKALGTPHFSVMLLDESGRALFLSGGEEIDNTDSFSEYPEVKDALNDGSGEDTRSTGGGTGKLYTYAVKLDDGNVLWVAKIKDVYQNFTLKYTLLPAFGICLCIALAVIAKLQAKRITEPVIKLAEDIEREEEIITGGSIYKEILPFIKQIRYQRARLGFQVRELKKERDKLAAIIENMFEGLIVLDENGQILMASESAMLFLNFDGEFENENIVDVTDNKEINTCIRRAAMGETVSDSTVIDGRRLQIITNPVVTDEVQANVICFLIDVTERMKGEKMRQEFTANVSHELKTPLTSISGYAEMIETGFAKPADVKQFAAIIRKEAGRLLVLIRDIIKLSELDEFEDEAQFEPVDLFEVAKECISALSLAAEKHNITMSVEGGTMVVEGSRGGLYELIYNLCDNAIRYNKENGEVRVLIEGNKLTVEDSGIGIPKAHQERIFERFYRVDKSRSKETGGTGLGLAIVKHVAEQHGAKIEIESASGRGTRIQVAFK